MAQSRTIARATKMDPRCLLAAWSMRVTYDGWSAGVAAWQLLGGFRMD